MNSERFWISLNAGETWRAVTMHEYINLERAMGFSAPPGRPATTSFSSGYMRGYHTFVYQEADPQSND